MNARILKSDRFGMEILYLSLQYRILILLKSDRFGMEIFQQAFLTSLEVILQQFQLKSDRFGMET